MKVKISKKHDSQVDLDQPDMRVVIDKATKSYVEKKLAAKALNKSIEGDLRLLRKFSFSS